MYALSGRACYTIATIAVRNDRRLQSNHDVTYHDIVDWVLGDFAVVAVHPILLPSSF